MIKNWIGSNGSFASAKNWSPEQAPVPGDDLTISKGDAHLSGGGFGFDSNATHLHLVGAGSAIAELSLTNASLVNTDLDNVFAASTGPQTGVVSIRGNVSIDSHSSIFASGNVPWPGTKMTIDIGANSHLSVGGNGKIGAGPNGFLDVEGGPGSSLTNGVTVADGGFVKLDIDVIGSFNRMFVNWNDMHGGSIEIGKGMTSGTTIFLSQDSFVQVDRPHDFHGNIAMTPAFSSIALEGIAGTSWSLHDNGSLLEIFAKSGALVDTLNLAGSSTVPALALSSFIDPTRGRGILVASDHTYQQGMPVPTHGTVV